MDPTTPAPAEITRILHEWQAGSREALDSLMPIVYKELRTLASRQPALLAPTAGAGSFCSRLTIGRMRSMNPRQAA